MTDFLMPSLGADMEAGTLAEWLVKPGDAVKRGDVVAVVETDKGAIEIEIFNDGVVSELVVPVGARVPVGTVLARLGDTAQTPAPKPPLAPAVAAPSPPTPPSASPPSASPPSAPARPRSSPAARRLAAARGIDLARMAGSGPGGAIVLADLEAPRPAAPRGDLAARRGFDPAAMRLAIGSAMSRSKREIPHYYLSETIDCTAALAWLERRNRDRAPPERVLPAALFVRAVALALAKTPELNGYWQDGHFQPGGGVHIGWAIALRGGGLVAPAIRDADALSVDGIMAAMRDLVLRARGARLRGSELTAPTITITSLGDRGAEAVWPIIYPPQVAMVGIGRIVTRPWVVGGSIAARPVVTLTLAGDHRASDGHLGGRFLAEIGRRLQEIEAP